MTDIAVTNEAAVVDQLREAVDQLYDQQTDETGRRLARALLERVRWWRIATGRFDESETLVRSGGFGLAEDSGDSLIPDLAAYYIFGDIVLDHLAILAVGEERDGAWVLWMQRLDAEPRPSVTRDLARDLDLMLRATRNYLTVHSRPLRVGSTGVSAPGCTTIDLFDLRALGASEASVELAPVLARHGFPNGGSFVDQLETLARNGRVFDQTERDAYRRWAKTLGMRSIPPAEITWRVVSLASAMQLGK